MSAKKKHRTANEYLQYLKGELSGRERHSFERELEADPFEKEALEGLALLPAEQAEEDILSLHTRLRKRMVRKRRIAFYSIAATVASLLIVGTVFLQIHDFNPDASSEPEYIGETGAPYAEGPSESVAEDPAESPAEDLDESPAEAEKSTEVPSKRTAEVPSIEPSVIEEIPVADAQEIIHMEAEPLARLKSEPEMMEEEDRVIAEEVIAEEVIAEEVILEEQAKVERRDRRGARSKSQSQPAAAPLKEMQKAVLTREEYNELVQGEISGIVISGEDQEPMAGVSVSFKGSETAVFTDMDGSFYLPPGEDSNRTIVANLAGMETQEYRIEDQSAIRLVMQPDQSTLDEMAFMGEAARQAAVPDGAISTVGLTDEEPGDKSHRAEPSGGYDAFKLYLEENIEFPSDDTSTQRAVVILRFTVMANGEIANIIAVRNPGEPFAREAIRLIEEGPSWNPASDKDGTIGEEVRLKIVFNREP